MKITLKGLLTELGSNYETDDVQHSGAIIRCGEQNLHFDLPTGQVQDLAPFLFDVVEITLHFTPPFARKQARRVKARKIAGRRSHE